MFVLNEQYYRQIQLEIIERQIKYKKKLEKKEVIKKEQEKEHCLKFFKEGHNCVEMKEIKNKNTIFSDDIMKNLFPIKTEEEHSKHWESFNKSRGK